MSIRQDDSVWRDRRVQWHGEATSQAIFISFQPGELFEIAEVSKLSPLGHLSKRYGYDVACAVCRHMELEGTLTRVGRFFTIPKPAKRRDRKKRKNRRL